MWRDAGDYRTRMGAAGTQLHLKIKVALLLRVETAVPERGRATCRGSREQDLGFSAGNLAARVSLTPRRRGLMRHAAHSESLPIRPSRLRVSVRL
jgi:hypothetical protein